MAKASRAIASAQLLLDAGDVDGACNRAYYAMFDAAHAALLWAGARVNPAETKTHRGLIAAFGEHLVKTARLTLRCLWDSVFLGPLPFAAQAQGAWAGAAAAATSNSRTVFWRCI